MPRGGEHRKYIEEGYKEFEAQKNESSYEFSEAEKEIELAFAEIDEVFRDDGETEDDYYEAHEKASKGMNQLVSKYGANAEERKYILRLILGVDKENIDNGDNWAPEETRMYLREYFDAAPELDADEFKYGKVLSDSADYLKHLHKLTDDSLFNKEYREMMERKMYYEVIEQYDAIKHRINQKDFAEQVVNSGSSLALEMLDNEYVDTQHVLEHALERYPYSLLNENIERLNPEQKERLFNSTKPYELIDSYYSDYPTKKIQEAINSEREERGDDDVIGKLYGRNIYTKLRARGVEVPLPRMNNEEFDKLLSGLPNAEDDAGSFILEMNRTKNMDFDKHLAPIVKAQGPGSKLFLDSLPRYSTLGDLELVTQVAKRYGTAARSIAETFFKNVPYLNPQEAKDTIGVSERLKELDKHLFNYLDLWDGSPVINKEIFQNYVDFVESGKDFSEIVRQIEQMRLSIIENTTSDDVRYNSEYFGSVQYAVFPPAIGITVEEYKQLNDFRPDRSQDVPREFEKIQWTQYEVSTGRFELESGERLSLGEWRNIQKAIQEVNAQIEGEDGVGELDLLGVAKTLVQYYRDKAFTLPETRQWLYENMYKLYYKTENAVLPGSFSASREGLMQYKEFVGDRVKNDLIKLSLKELQESDPNFYEAFKEELLMKVKGRGSGEARQIINRLSGYKGLRKKIENEQDPAKREKLLEKIVKSKAGIEEYLSSFGYELSDIENKTKAEIGEMFSVGSLSDDEIVARMVGAAAVGKANANMYKEVSKFSFNADTAQESKAKFEMIVSKSDLHGVAGYTQGVCVTPDKALWEDPTFMHALIMNREKKVNQGGMHILIRDNKLVLPGINPSLDLRNSADNNEIYDAMIDFAKKCKDELGLDQVLIPTNPQISSNDQGFNQIIADRKYKRMEFDTEQPFSQDPYEYSFKECFIVE